MENLIIEIDGVVIVIDAAVILMLSKLKEQKESGGVLYGFKVDQVEEYVITNCTFPQPSDERSFFLFERKDPGHFEIIKTQWIIDESTMYFGDWHYHPVQEVIPSKQDFRSFENICKESITSSKYIINIITAKKEMIVYVYDKKNNKLICQNKYKFGGNSSE